MMGGSGIRLVGGRAPIKAFAPAFILRPGELDSNVMSLGGLLYFGSALYPCVSLPKVIVQ